VKSWVKLDNEEEHSRVNKDDGLGGDGGDWGSRYDLLNATTLSEHNR
jgi:hypothetical protein